MEQSKKVLRYERIYEQLSALMPACRVPASRMASICAVLHHKMGYFFWTGFYLLEEGQLVVGPYQGPLACMKLEKGKGVCWAGIKEAKTIVVPDVDKFPGHIACDQRSKSEIVVPLFNHQGMITGVLDVDSDQREAFGQTDARALEKIVKLVYNN